MDIDTRQVNEGTRQRERQEGSSGLVLYPKLHYPMVTQPDLIISSRRCGTIARYAYQLVHQLFKATAVLTQTEMTSLPQLPELGSGRQEYTKPVNVFVYWLKVIGGGVQPKMPSSHGFPVVVSPST